MRVSSRAEYPGRCRRSDGRDAAAVGGFASTPRRPPFGITSQAFRRMFTKACGAAQVGVRRAARGRFLEGDVSGP